MTFARWFPLAVPHRQARARLVCLPCAGGGASMFREWRDLLPQCEVLAAQLPGREHRIREAPQRDLGALVDALATTVRALPDGPPLVLFGHSLGAMVAFALARELVRGGTPPCHLVAAAARAPHRPPRRVLHDLPLAVLLDELVSMGGTSPRVIAAPELVELIEPVLRADLWLAEHHVLRREPPLPVPMTVLGGTEDVQVVAADVEAWRELAGGPCEIEFVRGGHFFVRDARSEVVQRLTAVLPR